jgi:predicted GIY-YIG superfamily endonuclease
MGIIYLIKNNVNGKLYIGQTDRTIKKRWYEHCSICNHPNGKNKHFTSKKYSLEEKYKQALEYLNQLSDTNAVQRLDGSGSLLI